VSSSSCERAVLLVNSSFSRDRSRKRHEKRAVGRSLLHNLITLASMVRTATLNMQVGNLRDQQQLWENCFRKMFVRRRLWKDATPLKRRKQPNARARRARLGSKRGCHGAGWCLQVRVRSLGVCAAKCSKKGGACEMGRRAYAPPNAPGGAQATSQRVYVRWLPGALAPAHFTSSAFFRALCRADPQQAYTDLQAPARPMAASLRPQASSPGSRIGLFAPF